MSESVSSSTSGASGEGLRAGDPPMTPTASSSSNSIDSNLISSSQPSPNLPISSLPTLPTLPTSVTKALPSLAALPLTPTSTSTSTHASHSYLSTLIDTHILQLISNSLYNSLHQIYQYQSPEHQLFHIENYKHEISLFVEVIYMACALQFARGSCGMMAVGLEWNQINSIANNTSQDVASTRLSQWLSSVVTSMWSFSTSTSQLLIGGNLQNSQNSQNSSEVSSSGGNNAIAKLFGALSDFVMQSSSPTSSTSTSGDGWKHRSTLLYILLQLSQYTINQFQSIALREQWKESTILWQQRFSQLLRYSLLVIKGISILHFIDFITNISGKSSEESYPTVFHRLSGFAMKQVVQGAPGHKSSQLYVESRKVLWSTMIGLVSAIAITVDWQALQHYCYHMSMYLMNFLYRQRTSSTSQPNGNSNAQERRASGLGSTLGGLFARRYATSSTTSTSSSGASVGIGRLRTDGIDEDDVEFDEIIQFHSSTTTTNSINSTNSAARVVMSSSTDGTNNKVDLQCVKCHTGTAKIPYEANCGHVYCYLCLYELLPTLHHNDDDECNNSITKPIDGTSDGENREEIQKEEVEEEEGEENEQENQYCCECYALLKTGKPWRHAR